MRAATVAWAALIVLVTTLPWSQYRGHPHWNAVGWIPFGGTVDNVRDVLLNLALYAPLGCVVARAASGRRQALVRAAALAGVLSLGVELLQVFSHERFASMTDVVANASGAVLGAWLMRR